MSSEEIQVDLPVAVRCMREQNGYPDLESTAIGISILKPGDELVKRQDAEAAIAKERSRKYDEGFFEGRQSREEEILNKIKDKRQEFNNGRDSEYPQKVLTELLEEVEES